ncbi:nucleoside-diphosphate-sugar epimerase [Arthrobacter sp. AG367]|uniref:SDR family oxidoreductase n=1 Tax=Arthrobacter sp. AG367 TaxID=2572909 RepID=UPI0011A13DA5|nr:SDR family oxidoreductase [Arthrobacter sp. AG367]TWD46762.1 nucleoside-diphosphate-sugar epimerase [Arthrobacter sp. AG367]
MTVLIVGCGDVGTEAGLGFSRKGFRVVGWRRSPDKLPAPIEGVFADLEGQLPTIPADTSIVVYCVAAQGHSEDAYDRAYAAGLRKVLDALSRDQVKPQRFLFVSSTAVYGNAVTGQVDENTEASPTSFSGRVMLEGEKLLRSRLGRTGTDAVVLRLAGIYGPGRTRLIDSVARGTAVIPAEDRLTNRIYRDDAAAAIVHLTTMNTTPQSTYLGVDDEPVELGKVLTFLATELERPLPPLGEVVIGRGGDKRCVNTRLRSTGLRFEYPDYRAGYRAILTGSARRHP